MKSKNPQAVPTSLPTNWTHELVPRAYPRVGFSSKRGARDMVLQILDPQPTDRRSASPGPPVTRPSNHERNSNTVFERINWIKMRNKNHDKFRTLTRIKISLAAINYKAAAKIAQQTAARIPHQDQSANS